MYLKRLKTQFTGEHTFQPLKFASFLISVHVSHFLFSYIANYVGNYTFILARNGQGSTNLVNECVCFNLMITDRLSVLLIFLKST